MFETTSIFVGCIDERMNRIHLVLRRNLSYNDSQVREIRRGVREEIVFYRQSNWFVL